MSNSNVTARSVSTLLCLGLAGYYLCMIIPLAAITDWYVSLAPATQGIIRKWQYIGFAVLIASTAGLIVMRVPRGRMNWPYAAAWLALLGWMFISTAWSVSPGDSISYSLLILIVLGCCAVFWLLPQEYSAKTAGIAAVAIGLGVFWLRLKLTVTIGRALGGISPTLIGHFGFALMVLAFMAGKRWRPVGVVVGFGLIAFAQARTVFIGAGAFMAFYAIAAQIRDRSRLAPTIVLVVFGAAVLGLAGPSLVQWLSDTATHLLGVHDLTRTGGSGFSGRSRLWAAALDALQGHELTGYGFRTRGNSMASAAGLSVNAHSGLLNAVMDIGLIGAALFMAVYVSAILTLATAWATSRGESDRVSAAYLVGMIPILAVEPVYLNFATPSSFLMVLCLANPLVLRSLSKAVPAVPQPATIAVLAPGR